MVEMCLASCPAALGLGVPSPSCGAAHDCLVDSTAPGGILAGPAVVSVALDLTPAGDRALPVARQLAAQLRARLEPVNVVRPGGRAAVTPRLAERGDGLVIESLAVVPTLVEVGSRPYRLLCLATGADPDHGGVAHGVARSAVAPLVFVGPAIAEGACLPIRRLLVLPDSRLNIAAVRWIDRLASRLGAEVTLAHSARRAWFGRDRSALLVGRIDHAEGKNAFELLATCSVPLLALPARSWC